MKKKIKDITIEDMIKICASKEGCLDCPLYNICTYIPYYYKSKEDIEKEIDL